ncbi:MAG: radical SAM protein [Candidatus Freyarchaeota archaeon]|nr:radical SAM protein [Candidatus Jordarchaeia archaeon]MBS7269653.1 radical SAM protein [Candidatus Jordarchaeia archaeon]MBS7280386.1 radical SAM protein [Candidatus Jordarchaeia archaeon]
MGFEFPPYRPPSEAYSMLIRVTRNCPWNRCAFCNMYKGQKFSRRSIEEVKNDISMAAEVYGERPTMFWGDSNSIILKTQELEEILDHTYKVYPNLERITSYARAKTILHTKTVAELRRLNEAGLTRLHVGLETGDDWLLKFINKGATAEEMIKAGRMVVESGIHLSEYVILGLGGVERSEIHARETAKVLNQINPAFIRVRTLVPIPSTPLHEAFEKGVLHLCSPLDILKETRILIDELEVNSEFLSDHVSNYLPIHGKLPEDKDDMLEFLDSHIELLEVDPETGMKLLQPEYLRRL